MILTMWDIALGFGNFFLLPNAGGKKRPNTRRQKYNMHVKLLKLLSKNIMKTFGKSQGFITNIGLKIDFFFMTA